MFSQFRASLLGLLSITSIVSQVLSLAVPPSFNEQNNHVESRATTAALSGLRNCAYVQTFEVSLLSLIGSGITHIYIASLHLMAPGFLHLNDDPPSSAKFNQLWSDVAQLQAHGIIVMAMLGGAGTGSYIALENAASVSISVYAP